MDEQVPGSILRYTERVNIDTRIKQLSYSSRLLLHSCPRKFQLYRLKAAREVEQDLIQEVTFSLGHVIGAGIQDVLQDKSLKEIYWNAFLMWHTDLFEEDTKKKKSFWESLLAVEIFQHVRTSSLLDDYELVYYTPEGKTEPVPAVELSFIVSLPNGFKYRGFVDAVLRHKITGKILVLEVKTTGGTSVNAAQYKNSSQAIGYSVILDVLFPELSSYEVLYLVYMTKSREYFPLSYTKSYLHRALWIQELILDCELIQKYEEVGIYPMHGESCFSYYRECEYLNTCTLSTAYITSPITQQEEEAILEEHSQFHIALTVQDLIQSQLNKSTPTNPTTPLIERN